MTDLVALAAQSLAIVGKTGSGKTFTAKGVVEQLLDAQRRVCILDPTGVWWGLKSSADGASPGYPVAIFGGQRGDVPIGEGSGEALAKIIAQQNLPAVIDLSEMLIGQRHRFATDFAEALYRENRSPLHLVIDEADEFAPQNPLPETKRMLHHFDRIARRGRVRGFRVMLITQRPAVLHKNVLTQANALIAMRLTAPQDRAALQAWVEGNADAVKAKEVIGSLAGLQRGQGWVWAPEAGILERATFPAIATFDSSRTPDDDEEIAEPTNLAAVDLSGVQASLDTVKPVEPEGEKQLRAELTKQRTRVLELEAVVADLETRQSSDTAARGTIRQVLELLEPYRGVEVTGVALGPVIYRPPAPAQRQREANPEPQSHEGVTAPQQRILDALAQLEAVGVTQPAKHVVAVHAGVSPRSSGYTNNLGAMRGAGLVDYPSGGLVCLTAAGRKAANRPEKAMTLPDLHAAWLRVVTAPQGAILRALVGLYPKSIDKPALAARIGVSAASSGYTNNLGALRTLGVLTYPQPGHVAATDLLFPKGLRK